MIWLTWRQHRQQALFLLAGLGVLAAVLIPTGLQMYGALDDTGVASCLRKLGDAEFVGTERLAVCDAAAAKFEGSYGNRIVPAVLLVVLPALAGLFWGAPLVAREVEHGTHRLVWTQSVSRLRWAVVKFGLVGAGVLAAATAYALLTSWWITPLTTVAATGRFEFPFFDINPPVAVAYTLFALALGIAAGTVRRKVLPAMAITLVGFVVARVAVLTLARPRFQAPLERRFPVTTTRVPNRSLGDWVLSDGVHAANGDLIAPNSLSICDPTTGASGPAPPVCAGYNLATYQPGSRFWLFQYAEAGIFVALTAVLLWFAIRQVRRRIA
jgi:hypothetical protein